MGRNRWCKCRHKSRCRIEAVHMVQTCRVIAWYTRTSVSVGTGTCSGRCSELVVYVCIAFMNRSVNVSSMWRRPPLSTRSLRVSDDGYGAWGPEHSCKISPWQCNAFWCMHNLSRQVLTHAHTLLIITFLCCSDKPKFPVYFLKARPPTTSLSVPRSKVLFSV